MSAMEIILLIAGVIAFVVSFLLPAGKSDTGEVKKLADEEIKILVAAELERIRGHVDDVVEESVGYAMEKTERSLERLSNEKIMAVSEYSDTVLKEIHKNHEEVMFLYDMLNDKHKNLKNTVTEAAKTVKAVKESAKEAEAVVNTFQKLAPEISTAESEAVAAEKPVGERLPDNNIEEKSLASGLDISFMQDENGEGTNNNERILELYQEGKSKIAIAKELGLGVGEVKLVIDLHKNI